MDEALRKQVHAMVLDTRQFTRAMSDLERFYEVAVDGREGRCASVIGPAGSGKSTILESFVELHPPCTENGRPIQPVFYVKVPSNPSLQGFYDEILATLGAPTLSRETNGSRRSRLIHFLKRHGVRVLVLDEFQHLTRKVGTDRAGVCDAIKGLMNDARVGIVMAGVEESELVIQMDEQVRRRRIRNVRLRGFCDTQNPDFRRSGGEELKASEFIEFRSVLNEYSKAFGCPDTDYLCSEEVASRMLAYTNGLFGWIFNLVEEASREARSRKLAGVDEDAIQTAVCALLPDQVEGYEVDDATSRKKKPTRKMTKSEKALRSAAGELTTRNRGSGARDGSTNDDTVDEET